MTDVREESGLLRNEHPACDPFDTTGPAPVFPHLFANGVRDGLGYYQVLGLCTDGLREGPN